MIVDFLQVFLELINKTFSVIIMTPTVLLAIEKLKKRRQKKRWKQRRKKPSYALTELDGLDKQNI